MGGRAWWRILCWVFMTVRRSYDDVNVVWIILFPSTHDDIRHGNLPQDPKNFVYKCSCCLFSRLNLKTCETFNNNNIPIVDVHFDPRSRWTTFFRSIISSDVYFLLVSLAVTHHVLWLWLTLMIYGRSASSSPVACLGFTPSQNMCAMVRTWSIVYIVWSNIPGQSVYI